MRKYLLLLVLFLSSCSLNSVVLFDENFYKFNDFDGEGVLYMRMPLDSRVFNDGEEIVFSLQNCDISVEKGRKEFDESFYAVYNQVYDYSFSADVDLECSLYLDDLSESLTDKQYFKSEKYGFRVLLRYDFENTILSDNAGLKMRQRFEDGQILILISAFENKYDYQSLGDFISENYSGFTYEYKDFGDFGGFVVDDGSSEDANRTVFVLSENKDFIYKFSMSLPRYKYSIYKDFIFEIVKSAEFF